MRTCTREVSRLKSSLERSNIPYGTNTRKTNFPPQTTLDGVVCSFFTSAVITEVQIGEMSKLGSLIAWSCRNRWADSLNFLYVVSGSICKTFASFQHILWIMSKNIIFVLMYNRQSFRSYLKYSLNYERQQVRALRRLQGPMFG
jgi:hypothetical protein